MTGSEGDIPPLALWALIIGLGLGSFGLRFAFLGLMGGKPLPEWLLRHLRYTAVAVLPALVAPLVVWPPATGGAFDLPRVAAALVTAGIAVGTRRVGVAILCGLVTLYGLLWLLG